MPDWSGNSLGEMVRGGGGKMAAGDSCRHTCEEYAYFSLAVAEGGKHLRKVIHRAGE